MSQKVPAKATGSLAPKRAGQAPPLQRLPEPCEQFYAGNYCKVSSGDNTRALRTKGSGAAQTWRVKKLHAACGLRNIQKGFSATRRRRARRCRAPTQSAFARNTSGGGLRECGSLTIVAGERLRAVCPCLPVSHANSQHCSAPFFRALAVPTATKCTWPIGPTTLSNQPMYRFLWTDFI